MSKQKTDLKLNLRQKLFLKLYCLPPPGRIIGIQKGEHLGVKLRENPLVSLKKWYGDTIFEEVRGKTVVDLGCGTGEQTVGYAQEGAQKAIGVDIRPVYEPSWEWAQELGITDRVEYTIDPLRKLGPGSIDTVVSLNAFEHFHEPEKILQDVHHVLKDSGKLLVSFGPPWRAPYGVHMFFMIKYPWANVFFSENTIMTVRKLYRHDGASTYDELEAGLNQMTLAKFKRIVDESMFDFEQLELKPVMGLNILTRIPVVKEFFTNHVTAVLKKRLH